MSLVNLPVNEQTARVAATADAAAEARMFRRPSEWRIFWEAFSQDRLALGAAALIGLVCLASVLAPVLSPYDPTVGDNSLRLAPLGTPGHLLGLDGQGRDILSRLLWGGQVSLIIALLPVTVASVISVFLGLVAGFFGGKVDMLIMRTLDVFFAFPAVLLAVAIAGVLGPGMLNVMLSITIVLIPYISRVAYMATVTVKNELFVDQARVSGARPRQILFHHILPNTLSPVIVYGSTLVGIMIVLGAGLSFLGLGITPPRPDWGIMCSDGRNFLSVAPHVSAVPGHHADPRRHVLQHRRRRPARRPRSEAPQVSPAMAEALLEVDDLHTHFHLKNKVVRAVNGVSFSVRRGEIVGIAGESGAGKSVACLSILRLVPNPGADRARAHPVHGRGPAGQDRAADARAARPDRLDGVRGPAEFPRPGLHGRRSDRGGADPPQGPVEARGVEEGGGVSSGWWAFRIPSGGSTTTRTSCGAACSSG